MHLKTSSAKWRSFCLGQNELTTVLWNHFNHTRAIILLNPRGRILMNEPLNFIDTTKEAHQYVYVIWDDLYIGLLNSNWNSMCNPINHTHPCRHPWTRTLNVYHIHQCDLQNIFEFIYTREIHTDWLIIFIVVISDNVQVKLREH